MFQEKLTSVVGVTKLEVEIDSDKQLLTLMQLMMKSKLEGKFFVSQF